MKSRFSHRQIFLFPGHVDSSVSLLDNKINQVINYLLVSEFDNQEVLPLALKKPWNNMIRYLTENMKFRTLMQRLIDIDMDEQTLKNLLVICIAKS